MYIVQTPWRKRNCGAYTTLSDNTLVDDRWTVGRLRGSIIAERVRNSRRLHRLFRYCDGESQASGHHLNSRNGEENA
jgi:hypothetical protein